MFIFTTVLFILATATFMCAVFTFRSRREIAPYVRRLLLSALIPVFANLVIVFAHDETICYWAFVLYLCGTNIMIYYLLDFTVKYCGLPYALKRRRLLTAIIMGFDCLMVILNVFFGHVFHITQVSISNEEGVFYALESNWYHYIHLLISFLIVLESFGCFVTKIKRTSTLYILRYIFLLEGIVVVGIWEAICIFIGSPIDMSMIGYAICGLFFYYFSLVYTPRFVREVMLSEVVQNFNSAVVFFDTSNKCIYANKQGWELFDIKHKGFLGVKTELDNIIGDSYKDDQDYFECTRKVPSVMGDKVYRVEYHKLKDNKGIFFGSFVSVDDRTKEEMRHESERYLATHDSLTGILNSESLFGEVRRCLNENPDSEYLIITSDIKDFKMINDIFGTDVGDSILVNIARTVERYDKGNIVFGRISGDKFGLLMKKESFDLEFFRKQTGNVSIMRGEYPYQIVIHIGVYEIADRSVPVSVMFDRAFMAISRIKDDLQIRIAYYDDTIRDNSLFEQKIIGSIDKAIDEGQILPFFQVQVDEKGNPLGAEVLVRWEHPTEGFLAPGRFIDIFEKNGMIVRVDRYIWECACKILNNWQERGIDYYLSVNISPKDFYFVDIYKCFVNLVEKYHIRAEKLRLEITETAMMTDLDRRLGIINRLREYGFIVEMDDFGSGYSSLNMLKDLPIDVLKLDMLFLRKADNNKRAMTIIEFVLRLAEKLGIPVVSEGVETEEQLEFLINNGCRCFQGYYFSKPIPQEEFEQKYIEDHEISVSGF